MSASHFEAGPAVSAGPAPGGTREVSEPVRPRRSNLRKRLEIGMLAGPALIVYVAFVFLPVALAAYYSVYNWNGLGPLDRFIGFDNYARALTDPVFHTAIKNNFVILGLSLIIQGPIALAVALLLNRRLRGRGMLRVLIFVPYVLSEVIAGLAFRLILQPRGPFDAVLEGIGLGGVRQLWLADPDIALWTLFGVLTWKYIGLAIILFLAGLQGVPEELSEAAAIDGASWWQTQMRITIPLLGPTIRIWAFLSIIGSLQLFDMVWILTGGGPLNSTQTMASYMVLYGLNRSQVGFGSAVAVILFAISLVVAVVYQRLALRRDLAGSLTSGAR
jgi:raffinose/stachyose/melibiose transport system permease protein